MTVLKGKIQSDLNTALKSKDEIRTSTLRMLKAAIMKFEVAGAQKKEAPDEEILQIIGKEAKQRKESIEAFRKGGREDLATKEEAELKILQSYLPEQMSEEELKMIIQEVIGQVGAQGKGDFGKVMGALMPRVKGKAEGATVSQLLKALLPEN